jgi:PST family polysaccharide transporter
MDFVSRNVDNLLLARFVSQTDLGNYTRSYGLMRLPVYQMHTMMTRVLTPALTQLRDDPARLGRAWLRALSTAAALTAPIAIGMALSAPFLVEVLFGGRWLGMVPVLQILAASALAQVITTTVPGFLRATDATNTLFRLSVITCVMTLVGIAIGLPWGTAGVASALLVKFYAEIPISLAPCLRQTGTRPVEILTAMRGVLIASGVMTAVGLAVRYAVGTRWPAWQTLSTQVLTCALTYVVVLASVDRGTFDEVLGTIRKPKD